MKLEDLMINLEAYREESEGSVTVYKDDDEVETFEIREINDADGLIKTVLTNYGPGAFTFDFFTNQEERKGRMRLRLEMPPGEEWVKRSKFDRLLEKYRGQPETKVALFRSSPDHLKGFAGRWALNLFKTEADLIDTIKKEYGGTTWDVKVQSPNTLGHFIYVGSVRLKIDADPKPFKKPE